jgi:hypothetical protein
MISIMANKLECQTIIGNPNNNSNCNLNEYKLSLGVRLLSAIYIPGGSGYGYGHVFDDNGDEVAGFSLTFVPSSSPYAWTSAFYSYMPNCTDPYDFAFVVTCVA